MKKLHQFLAATVLAVAACGAQAHDTMRWGIYIGSPHGAYPAYPAVTYYPDSYGYHGAPRIVPVPPPVYVPAPAVIYREIYPAPRDYFYGGRQFGSRPHGHYRHHR